MQRAGLIGIGRMGSLMLGCLRRRGLEVAVLDERPGALEPFSGDAGVRVASSPLELAGLADVIGVVVFDDAQVLDVLEGPRGLLAAGGEPPVILIHSTLTAAGLRRAAAAAAARGFPLLDAAVSGGTTEQQQSGDHGVMVGGEAADLDRARPLLEAYAGLIEHVGPLGSGLDAKLVRNMASFAQVAAVREALDLARALGIATETALRILEHTRVMSQNTREILLTTPLDRTVRAADGPDLAAHARYMDEVAGKDLGAALARAAELEAALPLAEAARGVLARAYRVEV